MKLMELIFYYFMGKKQQQQQLREKENARNETSEKWDEKEISLESFSSSSSSLSAIWFIIIVNIKIRKQTFIAKALLWRSFFKWNDRAFFDSFKLLFLLFL